MPDGMMNYENEIKKLKFQLGLVAGQGAPASMSAIAVYEDMDEAQYCRVHDVFQYYSQLIKDGTPGKVEDFLKELKEHVPNTSDPMGMVFGMEAENRWMDVYYWVVKWRRGDG